MFRQRRKAMAVLNVSNLSSKLTPTKPPKPSLSPPQQRRRFSLPLTVFASFSNPQQSPKTLEASRSSVLLRLRESASNAGLVALLSASLLVADPALAFKVRFIFLSFLLFRVIRCQESEEALLE